MSGTSQDGVDVALIDTDGERISHFGATACRPYTQGRTHAACAAPRRLRPISPNARRGPISSPRPKQLVNDAHAEAVESFLAANGLQPGHFAAIGLPRPNAAAPAGARSHAADRRRQRARRRGSAFPSSMIFAPPMWRRAGRARRWRRSSIAPWCGNRAREPPVAVLNLGGVANVTYIDGDALIACDTGPGNALLDDFLRRAHRPPARHRWPQGRGRHGRRSA